MGLMIATLFRKLCDKKQLRILMLGLDGAGKTTILYKLKFDGELITTTPTIGFNVEIVKYKNLSLTIWDIGGQSTVRRLWHYYYQNTNAIIFVIDSSDHERLQEVKAELHNLLDEYELRDAVLLIFANKQDLETSLSIDEIQQILQVDRLKNRNWHIQATSALRNLGLYEGLDWLSKQLS